MPPPGAYVPPNQNQSIQPQGYGTQQQQQDYQQSQGATTYQTSGQGYSQPSQSHKTSGGTFGSMMNQAVTTSKPMLDRLSKTISSKLGTKHSTPGTPQRLQSYQNYQQHYNQQTHAYGQQQSQAFNPQGQQTQQQPQVPGTYPPQQPPYQHSSYGSVQGNHSTPQASPVPHVPYTQVTPTPPQPPHSSYNASQFGQGGNITDEKHAQTQQGHQHGQMGQAPAQGQCSKQPMQAQYSGQQAGVIGGSGHFEHSSNPQSPQNPISSPSSPTPQNSQWTNTQSSSEQSFTQVHQQQLQTSATSAQSYFPTANAQVQAHALPHNQQWTPLSATGSDGQTQSQLPPAPMSPPLPPPTQSKPPVVSSVSPLHSQSPTPAPQHSAAPSGPPIEFIAELPADMGSLSLIKSKSQEQASVQPVVQTSPYQAYQSATVQTGPTSPGFTIARRAVSVSNAPYADPWRFADPLTELPTREFYVIADLLFDALDRKFEPQNTGMLEASKVLESWIDLTEDATRKPFYYYEYTWSMLTFSQNSSLTNCTAHLAECGAYKVYPMSWYLSNQLCRQSGTSINTHMLTSSNYYQNILRHRRTLRTCQL